MLSIHEVIGGRQHWTPDMQSFLDCTISSELDHARTIGPLLTWTNSRIQSPIHKRLDRFLANVEWLSVFSEGFVEVKARGIMDQCPLLHTVPMNLDKIRKNFQFFNFMCNLRGSKKLLNRRGIMNGLVTLWPFFVVNLKPLKLILPLSIKNMGISMTEFNRLVIISLAFGKEPLWI